MDNERQWATRSPAHASAGLEMELSETSLIYVREHFGLSSLPPHHLLKPAQGELEASLSARHFPCHSTNSNLRWQILQDLRWTSSLFSGIFHRHFAALPTAAKHRAFVVKLTTHFNLASIAFLVEKNMPVIETYNIQMTWQKVELHWFLYHQMMHPPTIIMFCIKTDASFCVFAL